MRHRMSSNMFTRIPRHAASVQVARRHPDLQVYCFSGCHLSPCCTLGTLPSRSAGVNILPITILSPETMERFDVGIRCLRTRNWEHSLLGDHAYHSRQHTVSRSRDCDFSPSHNCVVLLMRACRSCTYGRTEETRRRPRTLCSLQDETTIWLQIWSVRH